VHSNQWEYSGSLPSCRYADCSLLQVPTKSFCSLHCGSTAVIVFTRFFDQKCNLLKARGIYGYQTVRYYEFSSISVLT